MKEMHEDQPTAPKIEPIFRRSLCLSAAISLAAAIGLAPLAGFLGRFGWLGWAAGIAFVIALLVQMRRGFRERLRAEPKLGEWAMATLGTTFGFAVAGLMGFTTYGVTWLLSHALGWLLHLAGWHFDPTGIFTWIFRLLSALFILAVLGNAIGEIWEHLYPRWPASQSVYRERLQKGGAQPPLMKSFVFVALALAIVLAWAVWGWAWGYWARGYLLAAQFAILGATVDFYMNARGTASFRGERAAFASRSVQAVEQALVSAGCVVSKVPIASPEQRDPLFDEIDLIAERGGKLFAIELKIPDRVGESIDWTACASLQSAATAYESEFAEGRAVTPVMVLFGAKASAGIEAFARAETLRFVEVSPASVRRVLDPADDEARKRLVQHIVDEDRPGRGGTDQPVMVR
jgi:hypothetical protein